ncbi:MAG: DegQ family serine endoprotease [Deltaproteobacteria bacterium]|nr:MAG: DegQ family serine endoprotease [Deltaproteobacteria bacterium]
MRRLKTALILLVLGLVVGFAFYGTYDFYTGKTDAAFVEAKKGGHHEGPGLPMSIPELVKKVKPAVVNISTTQIIKFRRPQFRSPFGRDPFEEFFEEFFGRLPREQKRRSLGSGFIVTEDGYILTNNHVVERADEITVRLYDETEYEAEVVGTDPKTDIALIKIDADRKLPHVKLGDSDALEVGEWVVAIGNPFGLEHTVTAGIVSAKGRVIGSGPYDDFIQTDASINPGNSGGPLFNLRGEVVGINTAIVQGGQGIGFAIPINMAKQIFDQLKEKGRVIRGWLGVYIQKLTPEMAKSLDLPVRKGVIVTEVIEDSPAEKGGIKEGDVIVEYNGKPVRDAHQLPALVAATKPGTKVKIKVLRDGKEKVLKVKIGEMPEEETMARKADVIGELGLAVQDITDEIARHLGIEDREGVIVTGVEPGSPADEAGIRERDIIRQVNRTSIKDIDEFRDILRKLRKEKSVLFLIERGMRRMFVVVKKR